MKRLLLTLSAAAGLAITVSAQNRTITGTVTYAGDNEPLAGATVIPVGHGAGVATDADGHFTLTVGPDVKKINVSYVGMVTRQLAVGAEPMDIKLNTSENALDEVVVTAFGVKRDRKGLGYAVQDIKAEDLNTSGTTSLASAMQGKLSGVEIKPSSGAPGASSNITIRGVRSFSGNNAPLYVVDGMPIESTPDYVQTGNEIVTGANYADRSIDINPDDIESINVLKGQAAAALYGVRATNGVIVITTKRGNGLTSSRPSVTFSTDLSAQRVSRKFKHQTEYAQGMYGEYDPTSSYTWGPKITDLPSDAAYGGETQNQYTAAYGMHPGQYYNPKRAAAGLDGWTTPQVYDNVGDFFNTGFTENANLSVSQKTDRSAYSFGLSNSHQEGIIPSTGLNRWGARGLVDWYINDQWKTGFSANYVHTDIKSAPVANSGIMNVVYGAPAEYDLGGIPYHAPNEPTQQISYRSLSFNNPYWWAANNKYTQQTQRFYGNAYVEFRPKINWGDAFDLVFKEQLGIDAYTSRYGTVAEKGDATYKDAGYIENISYTRQVFNNLVTANFTAELGADREWELGLMVGNEVNSDHVVSSQYAAQGLLFYGQPTFGNCSTMLYGSEYPANDRTVGIFFNANASWRDMVFLTVTGRNDWASMMPRNHRSYFYPSVSGAFVFTELDALKGNSVLSFGKIRASFAEVGQTGRWYHNFGYTPSLGGGFYASTIWSYPVNGVSSFVPYYVLYDENLKPQTTKNFEVGADLRLLNDRIRLGYTYSLQDVKDQIFDIPCSGSSGSQYLLANGGHIRTNTHELELNATIYDSRDFSVDLGVNWTKYESVVKELAPGVENIFLGGFVEPQVRAYAGYGYPVIFGTAFARDDQGRMYLDEDGLPMITGESQVIGKCTPDFNMGWTLGLRYKRVNLSTTWSWQSGGQMYCGTNLVMDMFGATEATLDRDTPVKLSGVDYITGQPKTSEVSMFDYQMTVGDISEAAIYDTDFVKMRDLTLTYNLPRLGQFDISVFGFVRNLLVWAKMPNLDPESSIGNNNAGGYFERFSVPNTTSFGGGLKVNF